MNEFFAYLFRLRYIQRWGLMRNTYPENVQEHSHQVCAIAHALTTIQNTLFGDNLDMGRVLELAVFHDASEVITGDLVTPIKYHNSDILGAYSQLEEMANTRLLAMLPQELQSAYQPLLSETYCDSPEWKVVKAADTLCAFIKCLEEEKASNPEFQRAAIATRAKVDALNLPCAAYFVQHFLPAFSLTLDELN